MVLAILSHEKKMAKSRPPKNAQGTFHGLSDTIGIFLFRCLTRRALPSGPPSWFGGRIDLPDITDPVTPHGASSGGLSPSVYSPRDGMQPEPHAHVLCRGERGREKNSGSRSPYCVPRSQDVRGEVGKPLQGVVVLMAGRHHLLTLVGDGSPGEGSNFGFLGRIGALDDRSRLKRQHQVEADGKGAVKSGDFLLLYCFPLSIGNIPFC